MRTPVPRDFNTPPKKMKDNRHFYKIGIFKILLKKGEKKKTINFSSVLERTNCLESRDRDNSYLHRGSPLLQTNGPNSHCIEHSKYFKYVTPFEGEALGSRGTTSTLWLKKLRLRKAAELSQGHSYDRSNWYQ